MKIATAICLVPLVAAPELVFAQDVTQPPIARPPISQGTELQATTTLTLETWRQLMARTPFPKAGCYTSSYPSTQWQEVPCSTAKLVPHVPAADPKPHNVGANNDYSAQVTGSLSSVIGSFDNVIGATGESDSLAGNEYFSLQLNTNYFNSPLCDNPNCYALQQYVYDSANDSPGAVYIQYWLLYHGSTCPTQTVANNNFWAYVTGGGAAPGCVINGYQATVPNQPIKELAKLRLTANHSPGHHSVVLETSGGKLYGGQDDGDVLGIGTQWNTAEFNVFGIGNSSTASFTPNPVSTIVVRTSVDNGTTNAPTCSQGGFTHEQNNLTPVPVSPCCPLSGASPAIVVTESNANGARSICACQSGQTWDSASAKCDPPEPAAPSNCFVSVLACQHLATMQCNPVSLPYRLQIETRIANVTPAPAWSVIEATSLGSGSVYDPPGTEIDFRACTFLGNGPKYCSSILTTVPPNDRGCGTSGEQGPLKPPVTKP
jgi:hypothetical protein